MAMRLLDEEWQILASFLPDDWEKLAKQTGAMQRERGGIRSAGQLLQVLLLHVASGLSLKQAAARAHNSGLATVSDVALLKRLKKSEPWLRELTHRMFEASRFSCVSASAPAGMRLRAVDATTVTEPGSTGTDWRVHYSVSLPEMQCDFYEVTDSKGGESYKRFPVEAGDLLLADRGYCHREGVACILSGGGHVVVRLNGTNFPLRESRGREQFRILEHLRQVKDHRPKEWRVRFRASGKNWPGRLCAIRKSQHAIDIGKKRLLKQATKNKRTLKPETLELAEYIFVLATVPRNILNTTEVLELYRARWQIELCFKRLKSLFHLGHVPKRSDVSARAWIEGKLLTALLIERLLQEARVFSPWGFNLPSSKPQA